jgi:hypothetical protein
MSCTSSGQCITCLFPSVISNGNCLNQCAEGYTMVKSKCEADGSTPAVLQKTLSSSVFPIPFTILGCVLFVACCMSKLQNNNTYLIGIVYSILGLI